jgi:hypothetical protein
MRARESVVVDVVDCTDLDLVKTEYKAVLARGRCPVVLLKGLSDPLTYMVTHVKRRAGNPRRIAHLRIHGHGAPGIQLIAAGQALEGHGASTRALKLVEGRPGSIPHDRSVISVKNLRAITPTLRKLTPYFTATAAVWLMGCNVGKGKDGYTLLKGLARIWRVPVSAGSKVQYAGGPGDSATFQLEGNVVTQYP